MKAYPKSADIATLSMPATPERFRRALAYFGVCARYDKRGMKEQVQLPDSIKWLDLTDGLATIIREMLATNHFPIGNNYGHIPDVGGVLELSAAKFNELLSNACAHNTVDPLVEYLELLPEWDCFPRLGAWIWSVFDVAEESAELSFWASEFVFLGTVTRAFNPGVKLDEMPILIGKGGIGKSTALRYALPSFLREMFTDGLNLAANPKERVEALQGRAIVEAAEMQGARRADLESLKAFLSRTDDGSTRLSYRRNPEPMPRRCVLIGTADRPDPLPDDSNLRRFVPITLTGGDPSRVIEYLDLNRTQLWAEALAMYRNGDSPRLPDYLKHAQAEAAEEARSRHGAFEDSIIQWLEVAPELFTLEMVGVGIGLIEYGKGAKISAYDSKRISGVLRHKGYENKPRRVEGEAKTVRRWAAK